MRRIYSFPAGAEASAGAVAPGGAFGVPVAGALGVPAAGALGVPAAGTSTGAPGMSSSDRRQRSFDITAWMIRAEPTSVS
ncbi:MAG: hypothetical protein ACREOJ_05620, partial [Gemmatimonadaceae bacterium]